MAAKAKSEPKAKAEAKVKDYEPRIGRKFCVRYNDVAWLPPKPHDQYRGGIRQPEVGSETERDHWQGYVEFTGPVTTKQCAEHLNIPWGKKGAVREHSLYLKVASGSREENTAYCGSSLYCKTHSKGDFKLEIDEAGIGIMVPDESFCECEDVEVKGQQSLPIIEGTWPPLDGRVGGVLGGNNNGGGRAEVYEDILAAIKNGKKWPHLLTINVGVCAQVHAWIDKMILQFQLEPQFSEHSHKSCCKSVGMKGIRWDDPLWQHSVVVVGNAGIGKTQWAMSHFNDKGCLFVTHLDDLKAWDPDRYDGIVFDDMSFLQLPLQTQKYLCDWNDSRTIHCRYTNAQIPPRTRKIFTCNWGEFPFDLGNTAVMDRLYVIETDKNRGSRRAQPAPPEAYSDSDAEASCARDGHERERSRSARRGVYDQPAYKAGMF